MIVKKGRQQDAAKEFIEFFGGALDLEPRRIFPGVGKMVCDTQTMTWSAR